MKVYACPKELPFEPDYRNYDFKKVAAQEETHRKALAEWLRKQGYTGKHTGKVLSVPFADGRANYMLADGSKSCLIHLPYGDAWNSPDVQFLPKKEVLRRIAARESLNSLFGRGA